MHDFPSGQWVGFYTYDSYSGRFLMDLVLEFKGGRVFGEGADDIAEFIIDGVFSQNEGECSWTKTYVARHSVEYRGFREQKGIWGTWTLAGSKGGFHIWPIGENTVSLVNEEEDEMSVPDRIEYSPGMPIGRSDFTGKG
jgi:hypothetical protein